MILSAVMVAAGFLLLARAADEFVVGAARLASALQVSPIVIGAVVIGFGTSAPEMLVSGLAAARGDTDLGVGNVLGSNIANLALVLPVAAIAGSVRVASATVRREVPVAAVSACAFVVLVWDGLTRTEGVVLAVALGLALANVIGSGRRLGDEELAEEVEEYLVEGLEDGPASARAGADRDGADQSVRPGVEVARTLVGLVLTITGAQLLVTGATRIADDLGLAEGFVGLTLVAIGTSLPELVTAVVASRKGEDELIVGNLLGSNVFNSLGVGAVIAVVGPGPLTDPGVVHRAGVGLVVIVVLSWMAMGRRLEVGRGEAVGLLVLYLATLPLLL